MPKVISENAILIMLGFAFIIMIYIIIRLVMERMKLKKVIRKYEKKEEESENIRQYTEIMENMVVECRKFKHDTKNIMAALMGYINSEDYMGLQEFHFFNYKNG